QHSLPNYYKTLKSQTSRRRLNGARSMELSAARSSATSERRTSHPFSGYLDARFDAAIARYRSKICTERKYFDTRTIHRSATTLHYLEPVRISVGQEYKTWASSAEKCHITSSQFIQITSLRTIG